METYCEHSADGLDALNSFLLRPIKEDFMSAVQISFDHIAESTKVKPFRNRYTRGKKHLGVYNKKTSNEVMRAHFRIDLDNEIQISQLIYTSVEYSY